MKDFLLCLSNHRVIYCHQTICRRRRPIKLFIGPAVDMRSRPICEHCTMYTIEEDQRPGSSRCGHRKTQSKYGQVKLLYLDKILLF